MITKTQLLHYSFFLSAVILPFSVKACNFSMGISLILILFNFNADGLTKKKVLHYLTMSTALFFLGYILSYMMHGLTIHTFAFIEKRILLLAIPILMLFLSRDDFYKVKQYTLNGIIIGSCFTSLFLLGKNFIKFFSNIPVTDYKVLFNFYHTGKEFVKPLEIHPTYLGSFFLFACLIIMVNFGKPLGIGRRASIFYLVSILAGLIFLNSRILYLLAFGFLLLFIVNRIRIVFKTKMRLGIIMSVCVVVLALIMFYGIKGTYVNQRMTKELKWDLSQQVGTSYSGNLKGDSRLSRWNTSLKVIRNKPFVGHGMGNEKEVLGKQFLKDGLKYSFTNQYDSHNQFLSTYIELGISGIIILLSFFGYNLFLAIKSRDLLYFGFLLIIITICLFENYLNRNSGILFVALFSTILGKYNLIRLSSHEW